MKRFLIDRNGRVVLKSSSIWGGSDPYGDMVRALMANTDTFDDVREWLSEQGHEDDGVPLFLSQEDNGVHTGMLFYDLDERLRVAFKLRWV